MSRSSGRAKERRKLFAGKWKINGEIAVDEEAKRLEFTLWREETSGGSTSLNHNTPRLGFPP